MFPTLHFGERQYSPDQLASEARRIAAGLAALGLREGASVAVMLRNGPACVKAVLACREAGLYLVPLNWHFKAAEAGHVLTDSGADVLIIHDDLLAQVEAGLPAGLPVISVAQADDGLAARSNSNSNSNSGSGSTGATLPLPSRSTLAWADFGVGAPAAPAPSGPPRGMVPYTSGTTGRPKGVRRLPIPAEQRAAAEAAQKFLMSTVFGLRPDARVLLSAPVYHSAPMSYLMNACANGVTLVLESSFQAERTLALIERHRITHAYLVPTMYQRLLRHRAEGGRLHDVSSIEQVASTGSPCAPDVKRAMIDWWGPVITEAYASSETGYLTFVDSTTWLARPGTAGRAVGEARVRILDDEGRDLPAGETGLIYGRQPAYPDFTYIGNPSARSALERDGLFTLGDMGYLDDEGHLFINDRKSDMVISGGVNIYPAEIESVLHTMPGVSDCAVFGIPDAEFGEALGAAVQLTPGAVLDASAVQAFLRERIANYKVPRHVEFHDALPREDTGKIFKRLLREPHWRSQARAI